MPRFRSNKEYAIRLTHPEFGEYYYQYSNYDHSFIFTKNLKRVSKWKTRKVAEDKILFIISKIKSTSKIVLPFGSELDDKYKTDKYQKHIYHSMKKFFFIIKNAQSQAHYKNAKDNIDRLNMSLISDVDNIKKLIKKNKHVEKGFMDIISNLTKDLNLYRKEHSIIEKYKSKDDDNLVLLDIIDASYGFRTLKLKNLKGLQSVEE